MALNEKLRLMQGDSLGLRPTTLSPSPSPSPAPRASRWPKIWAALGALALLRLCWTMSTLSPYFPLNRPHHHHHDHDQDYHARQQCLQADPLFPGRDSPALAAMDDFLASPQFLNASVPRLAGAVQIPTQSYDDMGAVGEDPRWDVMYDLAAYLEATFPLVHGSGALRLDKVNTHGLLYTWQGADPDLKPTVLMAHQDTVPVEPSTISQWTHPPFSGAFDGRHLWGRGASDCKNSLVGILEAVELLVGAGFRPRRTLVLAFGFDEEISGARGAGHLAAALLGRYGAGGVAVVVDEGNGLVEQWGTLFGVPAVAEKGYIDVEVVVRMPGGHSSVPPPHNGIGVMGELITAVEANLYEPHLHDENPFLGALYCGAAHAADFPAKLDKELRRRGGGSSDRAGVCEKKDRLALEAAKESDLVKYMFTTSVAADLIRGGAKVNALPERTQLTVNHRVNVGDRTADVKTKLAGVAARVADKFNLTLHAFPGDDDEAETPSSITLQVRSSLEPAPVSPTTVVAGETSAWSVLGGTTRAVYGDALVMAPGLSTGNTDTKFYWALTDNIYRYMPAWDARDAEDGGVLGNIHTVDERASMVGHVRAVRWFSLFVRNMDEADLP